MNMRLHARLLCQGTPWNILSTTKVRDYVCPSDRSDLAGPTSYLAVVGPDAAWSGEKPRKLADFGKDAHTTIMVVEVHDSGISWAEPKDLSLDTLGTAGSVASRLALPGNHDRRDDFFFMFDDGVNVVMADGTLRCLRLGSRSTDELRKLLQIGGCKEIDDAERHPNWPNIAALAVWLLSVGTLLTWRCGAGKRGRPSREICRPHSEAAGCLCSVLKIEWHVEAMNCS